VKIPASDWPAVATADSALAAAVSAVVETLAGSDHERESAAGADGSLFRQWKTFVVDERDIPRTQAEGRA
jgi:hypothetical protein